MNFQIILGDISLSTPSWDLLVLLVFVVGLFFYVLNLGRDKALVMLVSSYITMAVMSQMEVIHNIVGWHFTYDFLSHTIVFLLGMGAVFMIISRSALTSVFDQGMAGSWFQALLLGFLQIGLMVSVIINFLPVSEIQQLSLFLRSFFVADGMRFFWLIGPLFAMIIIKK